MKTNIAACILSGFLFVGVFAQTEPSIQAIQQVDSQLVVSVEIDAGFSMIRVEIKDDLAAGGTWVPLLTEATPTTAGVMDLMVPLNAFDRRFRILCFRADEMDPTLFSGETNFELPPTSVVSDDAVDDQRAAGFAPPAVADSITTDANGESADPGAGEDPREVSDVDLWTTQNDRTYIFNRYRGLQIVDVSTPDESILVGELEMAGRGERMVALDDNHLLLLLDSGCYYNASRESEGVVINIENDVPTEVARFEILGYIREARLVGQALYVLSHWADYDSSSYRSVTLVSTFDLTDPTQPTATDTHQTDGWSRFVTATPDRLVVGTSPDYYQTSLSVFDISSPIGQLNLMGSLLLDGRVDDEYKVWIENSEMAVIYWDPSIRTTIFETYDLSLPVLAPLGRLTLAEDERLFGTRFGANRQAYIVTFLQIDPLWIVDFTDLANPEILGELEIPGFSTYLVPLDDRLLSIGTESGRVAVSLFDVADPSTPSMLSRIYIGERWSWSEAVYEEKAFQVLPDANAILVPYSSGGETGVQFIDLLDDELVERGLLAVRPTPRRTRQQGDRFFAVEGEHLNVIDASDRDAPFLTRQVPLSREVQAVYVESEHVVEVGSSEVRVYDLAGELLNRVAMPQGHIMNRSHVDGRLDLLIRDYISNDTRHYHIDLSTLPILAPRVSESLGNINSYETPLRPRDGLVVWRVNPSYFYYVDDVGEPQIAARSIADFWNPPANQLVAIDTTGPNPVLMSDFELPPIQSDGWDWSPQMVAADGKVYVSRTVEEYRPIEPEIIADDTLREQAGLIADEGRIPYGWYQQHMLQVIDYTDAAVPTVRPAIPLKGSLLGVSDNGVVLFTSSNKDTETGRSVAATELNALAYDGVTTYLVDTMEVGDNWGYLNVEQRDRQLLLQVNHLDSESNSVRRLLPISLPGREFVAGNAFTTESPYQMAWRNDVLVAYNGSIYEFFDMTDPMAPLALSWSQQNESCARYGLQSGDGRLDLGFLLPSGVYGRIDFTE